MPNNIIAITIDEILLVYAPVYNTAKAITTAINVALPIVENGDSIS